MRLAHANAVIATRNYFTHLAERTPHVLEGVELFNANQLLSLAIECNLLLDLGVRPEAASRDVQQAYIGKFFFRDLQQRELLGRNLPADHLTPRVHDPVALALGLHWRRARAAPALLPSMQSGLPLCARCASDGHARLDGCSSSQAKACRERRARLHLSDSGSWRCPIADPSAGRSPTACVASVAVLLGRVIVIFSWRQVGMNACREAL